MTVVNRRNAVFGWLAWAIVKEALRGKSHKVLPTRSHHARRKLVVPAAIAAAVGGAVLFYRRQNGTDGAE